MRATMPVVQMNTLWTGPPLYFFASQLDKKLQRIYRVHSTIYMHGHQLKIFSVGGGGGGFSLSSAEYSYLIISSLTKFCRCRY